MDEREKADGGFPRFQYSAPDVSQNLNINASMGLAEESRDDVHCVVPRGQPVKLASDDMRFIYRTLMASADETTAAVMKVEDLGDPDVLAEAQRLVREEVRRAIEMARYSVLIDGQMVSNGLEFRSHFEDTSGVEPLNTALAEQVQDLLGQIANQTTNSISLRKHVPQSVMEYFSECEEVLAAQSSAWLDGDLAVPEDVAKTVSELFPEPAPQNGQDIVPQEIRDHLTDACEDLHRIADRLAVTRRKLETVASLTE